MNRIKLSIPKKKSTKVIFFRTDEETYSKIKNLAKSKKVKISELMRAFVELAIKKVK